MYYNLYNMFAYNLGWPHVQFFIFLYDRSTVDLFCIEVGIELDLIFFTRRYNSILSIINVYHILQYIIINIIL